MLLRKDTAEEIELGAQVTYKGETWVVTGWRTAAKRVYLGRHGASVVLNNTRELDLVGLRWL